MSAQQIIKIANLLAQVICTLHATEPPIIHRDVSPDNVLWTAGEQRKLIDFSVAARKESDISGEAVGKTAYMSPDQFRGFIKRTNDIYSFGATLYFLATAHDPEPISELHLPEIGNETDRALDAIIARCTSTRSTSQNFTKIEDVLIAPQAITV